MDLFVTYLQSKQSGGMERLSLLLLILLTACCSPTQQATIGDGRISLYTGRPINASLSSPSPGSCEVDGLYYPSETAIPREHPCHYCICYRAKTICYWKQCAAAPPNCAVMYFEHVCNPSLYMCKIPQKARSKPVRRYGDRIFSRRRSRFPRAASSSSSSSSSSWSPLSVPPFNEPFPVQLNDNEFLLRVAREATMMEEEEEDLLARRRRRAVGSSRYNKANSLPVDKSCSILGVTYNLGEVIGVASDVCMECRCAAGKMFCSPRCCFLPSSLSLSASRLQQLASADPPPSRPHPLHYVRNQIATR